MHDIPANMIIDSVDAGAGAFIDLFEADLQPYGGDLIRFHSGTNGYYGNVMVGLTQAIHYGQAK